MAPKLPAKLQVARNEQIVQDRLKPMSWAKVAARNDISVSSAKRIVADFRAAAPKLSDADPFDIVWESVERYEQWIEQLTDIAAEGDSDASKINAVNAQARLQAQRDDLLQKSGILPQNLGKLKIEHDIRFLAQLVVQIMSEDGVPVSTQRRIANALRGGSPDVN